MMKKFLTSKEAASYLQIQESELQEMLDKGKIPVYKIGGVYARFRVDDLAPYRSKRPDDLRQKRSSTAIDRIRDFFYFNDFYIFSVIVIIIILYFIFK